MFTPQRLTHCILTTFFLTFLNLFVTAQVIEGRITSTFNNAPLEGVDIILSDSSKATVSDAEGYFRINSSTRQIKLTLYFRGILRDSLTAWSGRFTEIQLKVNGSEMCDDCNHISTTNGSAISTIHRYDFTQGVAASEPEQLIQGRVAGMQMTSASGDASAYMYTILRGVGSMYNTQPLVVLDGVPLSGYGFSPSPTGLGLGTAQDRNPLRFIHSDDIEKIEILKDGSSALYGARGGNGVVNITTRSGGKFQKQIEYSSQLSIATLPKRMSLLNRDQFLSAISRLGGDASSLDYGGNTDWQSEVFREAISQKHDLAFSHGYKGGNLHASIGYEDQQGIIHHTSMERFSGNINVRQTIVKDRLQLGGKLMFTRVEDELPPVYPSSNDVLSYMISANPTWPRSLANEHLNTRLPNNLLQNTLDKTMSTIYWLSFSADFTLNQNFNIQLNTNLNGSSAERNNVYGYNLNRAGISEKGHADQQHLDISNTFYEGRLSYSKKVNNGSFDASLGFSDQRFRNDLTTVTGKGFASGNLGSITRDLERANNILTSSIPSSYHNYGYTQNPSDDGYPFFISSIELGKVMPYDAPSGVPVTAVTGTQSENNYVVQSLLLRVGYTYRDKFFLSGALRRDASNPFGDHYSAGYFPVITAGWEILKPDLFPSNRTYLKARLSFGTAGNVQLLHNVAAERLVFTTVDIRPDGSIWLPGTTHSGFENKDYRWESIQQLNAGFDFKFGDGLFFGTIDTYKKVTKNLLAYGNQPTSYYNHDEGKIVNKGLEVSINSKLFQQKSFSLLTGITFSYNSNKLRAWSGVEYTGNVYGVGVARATTQRLMNDEPLNQYFLKKFIGFNENGISKYVNTSLTENPYVWGISATPRYNAGFSLTARYHRVELNGLLSGQFGHYLYNNTANVLLNKGAIANGMNVTEDVASSKEASINTPDVSTRFLEKADFIRLQALSLCYRHPLSGSGIKAFSLSLTGQNLFVSTSYSGFDPEVNTTINDMGRTSFGNDYTAYPRARIYSLRIGITL